MPEKPTNEMRRQSVEDAERKRGEGREGRDAQVE